MKKVDSEEFEVTLKGKKYNISLETISEDFNFPNRDIKLLKKTELKKIRALMKRNLRKRFLKIQKLKLVRM